MADTDEPTPHDKLRAERAKAFANAIRQLYNGLDLMVGLGPDIYCAGVGLAAVAGLAALPARNRRETFEQWIEAIRGDFDAMCKRADEITADPAAFRKAAENRAIQQMLEVMPVKETH